MDPRLGVAAPGGAATMSSLAAFRIEARVSSAPNNRSLTYCLYRHPRKPPVLTPVPSINVEVAPGRNYLHRVEAGPAGHHPTIPDRVKLWDPLALRALTAPVRD